MKITEVTKCRACGFNLPETCLLNLGEQAIVDFPKEGEEPRGRAPLQLMRCGNCQLVQLRHSVDADTLYRKFWYRSGVNEQMKEALKEIVREAKTFVDLAEGDFVCDIGSNDGELLTNYGSGLNCIGFEPAQELAEESQARFGASTVIIPDYFSKKYYGAKEGSFKIITAIAMFYDLEDPGSFLRDVRDLLHFEGVFVVQMNYLGLMLKNVTFDNISHEHLCYYSLESLIRLFEKNGLTIFHASTNDVNGGSLRVFASKKMDVFPDASVEWMRAQDHRLVNAGTLQHFVEMVDVTSRVLLEFLENLKRAKKKVYVYGASTRGLTLLQNIFKGCKATDYLVAAAERDGHKFGRYMAGVNIPIIPEEEARKEADYFLILPYHFWPSIRDREWAWLSRGGRFIIPLPFPRVIEAVEVGDTMVAMPVNLDEALVRI